MAKSVREYAGGDVLDDGRAHRMFWPRQDGENLLRGDPDLEAKRLAFRDWKMDPLVDAHPEASFEVTLGGGTELFTPAGETVEPAAMWGKGTVMVSLFARDLNGNVSAEQILDAWAAER